MESARFKIKESGICTNACNAILSSIFGNYIPLYTFP